MKRRLSALPTAEDPGYHGRINGEISIARTPPPGSPSELLFSNFAADGLDVSVSPLLANDGFRKNLSRRETRVACAGSPRHRRSQSRREGLRRQGRHCGKVPKSELAHVS